MSISEYEMVIGLEVHAELKIKTKIFCGCSTAFGAKQNTNCCPVCTGMPGAMPVLNRKVVEYAVKAGLALDCEIALTSGMDRKNYFYPDLPKAYQISQFDAPLCKNGFLDIEVNGNAKRIGITRIHIEEDAGKLIHDKADGTLIDCNRCGVPLIEIVSEPDIRSAEEAKAYVKKLRSVLLYTGVSDCRMNEGSLRCDINLSVRKKGETKLGVRTEMKNLNSFQFIGKAIEYEFARQVEVLESGEQILQETRRFDQNSAKTFAMRSKENLSDYRFFAEPDLLPIRLKKEQIESWKAQIPVLPDIRMKRYRDEWGISLPLCTQLCELPQTADFFEAAVTSGAQPKTAANLTVSELLSKLPEGEDIPIKPEAFASVCRMLDEEKINNASARKVIAALFEADTDPVSYVEQNGLEQINDCTLLSAFADEAIAVDKKTVEAYLAGKQAAAQAIIGKVIKASKGRGNPNLIHEIVLQKLDGIRRLSK